MLGVLCLAACGCAGRWWPGGWRADPDVLALARVYHGAEERCTETEPVRYPLSGPRTRRWRCAVEGWAEVTLLRQEAPNEWVLIADRERWDSCRLERFADRFQVFDDSEAAIRSERSAALRTGPLAGACMAEAIHWDRPGCRVTLFPPAGSAGADSGCREAFAHPR